MWAFSERELVFGGSAGVLLKTSDGGSTWAVSRLPSKAHIFGMWGANDLVLAVGLRGTILRSTDRGATFVQVESGTTTFLTSVWGDGRGTIFVGGQNALLRSTDWGQSFADLGFVGEEYASIWGDGKGEVLVTSERGSLYRSVDNGAHWETTSLSMAKPEGGTVFLRGVWQADNGSITVAAEDSLVRSTDGGRTYKRQISPAKTNIEAIWGLGSELYLLERAGALWRSADGGQSFEKTASFPGQASGLFGLPRGAGLDLYALGYGGEIWRSIDRGKTWRDLVERRTLDLAGDAARVRGVLTAGVPLSAVDPPILKGPVPLPWGANDILLTSNDRLVVAGDQGAVLTSDDGGAHFSAAPKLTTAHLYELREQRGTIVAIGGTGIAPEVGPAILRSTDGARSWTRVPSPSGVTRGLLGLWADEVAFVAVGYSGLVLRSTDGGASWQEVPSPTDEHLNGVRGDEQALLAVGARGVILRSTDHGEHWSKQELENLHPDRVPNDLEAAFAYQGVLYVCGSHGLIAASSDHGQSWVQHAAVTFNDLSALWGDEEHGLFAFDRGGAILKLAGTARGD
ncbi:MAG: hypothetical protein U0271_20080 [Polyangiaceae bacterium]